MKKNRIIIGADIVPTESNVSYFCDGDIIPVVGEALLEYIGNDSFLICNLETPLINSLSPIIKCGPAFGTPVDAIKGIKALGVDLVSLANNHIKDQGENGIISTCQIISSYNLDYIGVGKNKSVASLPYIFEFSGKSIGIYSCCEHEFSSATENTCGANTFDAFVSLAQIEKLKEKCDYIIVLYHGGKEYYRFPSPELQKTCRCIIDKGADLIVCQHSHCIGSKEEYKKGVIVYGQGNFIFAKKDNEYWNSSLLINIDGEFKISYLPIIRTELGTRLATEIEKETIIEDFQNRSLLINSSTFVEDEYNKFSNSLLNSYITTFNGKKSKAWYALNKMSRGFLEKCLRNNNYPLSQLVMLKNYIECEAHRELIIRAIDCQIKKSQQKK